MWRGRWWIEWAHNDESPPKGELIHVSRDTVAFALLWNGLCSTATQPITQVNRQPQFNEQFFFSNKIYKKGEKARISRVSEEL